MSDKFNGKPVRGVSHGKVAAPRQPNVLEPGNLPVEVVAKPKAVGSVLPPISEFRFLTNVKVPLDIVDMNFLAALGEYRLGPPVATSPLRVRTAQPVEVLLERGFVGIYCTTRWLLNPMVQRQCGFGPGALEGPMSWTIVPAAPAPAEATAQTHSAVADGAGGVAASAEVGGAPPATDHGVDGTDVEKNGENRG